MYFYRALCKKPTQNSISRSMFWCLGFLSFWRIKNSYLIHPLSENSNLLWEFFLSLTCVQKIMNKFNLCITFPDAQLQKYCDFMCFSKKFKINWGLVEIYIYNINNWDPFHSQVHVAILGSIHINVRLINARIHIWNLNIKMLCFSM